MTDTTHPPLAGSGRAGVIHPDLLRGERTGAGARAPKASLAEAEGLAAAIGLAVAYSAVVTVPHPRPATLLGQGKVEEIGGKVAENHIEVVFVDAPLTPVQQRNLEKAWACKVVDRTGLILEIFADRARTREGRLQVELARLSYQRSRLVRTWNHLERQRGGRGFLAGPGERQIESDRRLIADRIAKLKRELEEVRRTRTLHRASRKRVPYPVIALVGYTNAGKSTLFNRLTAAEVMAKDMLFATLDPTMRQLRLPSGRNAIVSDTVGFISDLPHDLVAAFSATLEEVREADVIVHVRDASHPDAAAQKQDVETILQEVGVDAGATVIEVLNKIDLLPAEAQMSLAGGAERTDALLISALEGNGLDALLARIEAALSRGDNLHDFHLPLSDGASIAWLYANGRVVERADADGFADMKVGLSAADAQRFRHRLEQALPHAAD